MGLLRAAPCVAARVPSGEGYDFLIRDAGHPGRAAARGAARDRRDGCARSTHDVEQLLDEASRLLSALTRQLGLAVAASLEHERLVHLDLEPLGERRALLVLGLGGGAARTLVLELESPLDARRAGGGRRRCCASGCSAARSREVRDRLARRSRAGASTPRCAWSRARRRELDAGASTTPLSQRRRGAHRGAARVRGPGRLGPAAARGRERAAAGSPDGRAASKARPAVRVGARRGRSRSPAAAWSATRCPVRCAARSACSGPLRMDYALALARRRRRRRARRRAALA